MKVLQVIHGYPMRYNAGSEVYTQGLCQALANRHEVHVFTRQENAFLPEYELQRETDPADPRVALHVINMARARDGYSHREVDGAFAGLLDELQPDVVHIGHLNHLSTSLVFPAKERGVPVVFTLHDYWLMCPRGQFIQMYEDQGQQPWPVCDGQDDRKCAVRCYRRYFGNDDNEFELDAAYWTGWVNRRMAHVRRVRDAVDVFIAPARYLLGRFRDDFGIPEGKLVYLDYGFHRERMAGRARNAYESFTFGYIGTHIPAKGVNHLIQAFGELPGQPGLRIWGRDRGVETAGLKRMAEALDGDVGDRVEWMKEYRNQDIVPRRVQPLRRHRRAVHLGGEFTPGHPRGAPGRRAGDHRRLRRHGRVRAPRAERASLQSPRPVLPGGADAGAWSIRRSGRDNWDVVATCSRTTATCPT